jgi:hypothetical protein
MYAYGSFVHQKCYNYALTNLLFSLCKSIRIIDLLDTHPNPIPELQHVPFTSEMLQVKKSTPTPSIFIFGLEFESFKEFERVSPSLMITWNYLVNIDGLVVLVVIVVFLLL